MSILSIGGNKYLFRNETSFTFLPNHFEIKDIKYLSKKQFYLKYFDEIGNFQALVIAIHIHSNDFNQEVFLNIELAKKIIFFVKLKKIKKVIFISTTSLLGNNKYSFSKSSLEKIYLSYDVIVIRPSLILDFQEKKIIGGKQGVPIKQISEKLINNKIMILPKIINKNFSYCFKKNLIEFILKIIKSDNNFKNNIVYFSSHEFISFIDFILKLKKIYKSKSIIFFIPMFLIRLIIKFKFLSPKLNDIKISIENVSLLSFGSNSQQSDMKLIKISDYSKYYD